MFAGDWTYMAFVAHSPRFSGTLELHKFLSYLVHKNHISSSEYLVSIEPGNEVVEGTGMTTVDNYAIEVQ